MALNNLKRVDMPLNKETKPTPNLYYNQCFFFFLPHGLVSVIFRITPPLFVCRSLHISFFLILKFLSFLPFFSFYIFSFLFDFFFLFPFFCDKFNVCSLFENDVFFFFFFSIFTFFHDLNFLLISFLPSVSLFCPFPLLVVFLTLFFNHFFLLLYFTNASLYRIPFPLEFLLIFLLSPYYFFACHLIFDFFSFFINLILLS